MPELPQGARRKGRPDAPINFDHGALHILLIQSGQRMTRNFLKMATLLLVGLPTHCAMALPRELEVGIASHAFDHLGSIGDQAEAAAASGANIIYVTGLGTLGYQGLPAAAEVRRQGDVTGAYLRHAKRNGIRLAIGYLCATSIVKLETFDKNWSAQF